MKKLKRNIMFGITALAFGMTLTGCSGIDRSNVVKTLSKELNNPKIIKKLSASGLVEYKPDKSTEEYVNEIMSVIDSGYSEEVIQCIYGPPSAFDYDVCAEVPSLLYGPPPFNQDLEPQEESQSETNKEPTTEVSSGNSEPMTEQQQSESQSETQSEQKETNSTETSAETNTPTDDSQPSGNNDVVPTNKESEAENPEIQTQNEEIATEGASEADLSYAM